MKRGSPLSNVEITKACGTSIEGRVYDFAPGERWLVTEAFADRLVTTGHARRIAARARRLASQPNGETTHERIERIDGAD